MGSDGGTRFALFITTYAPQVHKETRGATMKKNIWINISLTALTTLISAGLSAKTTSTEQNKLSAKVEQIVKKGKFDTTPIFEKESPCASNK